MKNLNFFKLLIAGSILGSLLLQTKSYADTFIGADIEVGLWSPSSTVNGVAQTVTDENNAIFASATLEHPIPMLPNIKVSLSSIDNNLFEYSKIDATGYYEILDNDVISIDVGLGATWYREGKYLAQDFDGVLPHVYVDAELSLPFTGTTAYTDIHYINYNDNSLADAIVGLRYDINLIAVDVAIKAGYRVHSLDTVDLGDLSFDIKSEGYFVALHADL